MKDPDIEFVCNSLSWALFRKEVGKGEIHVLNDNYQKYKMLMKKHRSFRLLGCIYMCFASSHMVLTFMKNAFGGFSPTLFYLCSTLFFLAASSFKKYSLDYDDGTFYNRMKLEQKGNL